MTQYFPKINFLWRQQCFMPITCVQAMTHQIQITGIITHTCQHLCCFISVQWLLLPLSAAVFYHGKIQIEWRLVNTMCQSYDMNIRGNTNITDQSDIIRISFTFSDFIAISIVLMQSYCKPLTLSEHNVCHCAEYGAHDLADRLD